MKISLLTCLSFAVVLSSIASHAEEGETPKTRIGPGKAVLEAVEANGIKLSEKAAQNLNLR
ncbi:MAG: hypothetical protein AB7H97_05820, partial [Pseudobdellovibrionaceae bacterium]